MSITLSGKIFVAIVWTLACVYCGAVWGNTLKTEPQWLLSGLMVLCLVLHCVLPRKWARLVFGAWVMMLTFFMLWLLGYEWAMGWHSNCFVDESGEQRCVMPIFQVLVGLVLALLGEVLIVLKLRRFSQPKWERMGQVCALMGLMVGAFYGCAWGLC